MAEGIVFNIMGKLMSKFGSLVAENMRMKDDLEKLIDNMSEIKAVVMDAEELQATNRQVHLWLNKLKDALDDADNLLDDFSYEDKKRQVLSKDCISEVCIFFTSSNSFLFSMKMGPRVRDIGKKLQVLNVEKTSLMLTTRNPVERVVKIRETHSFIRAEHVIGRDKEKEYLVELLLKTNMDMKENVSIISIVGIGGLGKTALAQLLYNEKAFNRHFDLKMWVCVSDEFDVKTIAEKITGSKTNEMDRVQQELRKQVEGKKYLLVLDDIWNEDRELWLQLKTLLMDGAKGSKIIITTRSEKVAKISGTSSPFLLDGLDEEHGWKLFCQLAFENGKEPENQKFVSIGKEILQKCSGVPLAIRSVGSLMYSMETESDWLNFMDRDLEKIDEKLERGKSVFEIIKLSYDHLPIHLKKCFAFCSLFPKDYKIQRMDLIRLWVAEGFVQSSDESTCLEDVGDEYFKNLVHRSFFQDFERNIFDDAIDSCKMHDLMHDMAKSVLGNDSVTITKQGQRIDKQTRHVSFGFQLDYSWRVPSSLLEANKLRTFLLPLQRDAHMHGGFEPLLLDESDCNLIVSTFEQLRVLDLNSLTYRMLPSCIDKLQHLRYLNLCRNEKIELLPRSITKLYNLETLLLNYCYELRELPSDLRKLISLRNLELDSCYKLTYMPRGIGELSNLQTLTVFKLDKKFKHSGGASELRGLNQLRNYLEIKGLECLRDNPSEAMEMNLIGKSNLTRLSLTWNPARVADENERDKDNLILQGLLPHHNIKSFAIKGFGGVTISCSINPFMNLLGIDLIDCRRLQSLPPLHLLLHLKRLCLTELPCLEWIDNNSSDNNSSTFFPSLKSIVLSKLSNLKGWCKCAEEGKPRDCAHQLKSLDKLQISDCGNLISLPGHTYIEHVFLSEVNEKILQQAVYGSNVKILTIYKLNGLKSLSTVIQHLTELHDLSIVDCKELDPCNDENGSYSMQWKQLSNLRRLDFFSIRKMEYLPEGLQHITTLQSIDITFCPNLRSIPEWARSLQLCQISGCPKLESPPEWVKVLDD